MSIETSTPTTEKKPAPKPRINLRTPEVMELVEAEVERQYRSLAVEKIRAQGGIFTIGDVTIKLAKEFGFCYGVERAIDLAYAARKVFKDNRMFILGEIIHNPEVNGQIAEMGIVNIVAKDKSIDFSQIKEDDVVIVPAFGAEIATVQKLKEIGCYIVDTTCGDVMRVWKRVRQNAKEHVTSIIHGKAQHEETKATSSHAVGEFGGHYVVVLNLAETDIICDYIRNGGDKTAFLERFKGATSEGFDPDIHLKAVGVANQTTMLRFETEEIQRRLQKAVEDRDGKEKLVQNYRFFDTICGATQDRQGALYSLLGEEMDLLLVIGGYNSSNTSHLAEIGEEKLPTYFIRNASKIESADLISHYNQHTKAVEETKNWFPKEGKLIVGITAGASCPNSLIEEVILRIFELRGIGEDKVLSA